jgi:hypothetical protein
MEGSDSEDSLKALKSQRNPFTPTHPSPDCMSAKMKEREVFQSMESLPKEDEAEGEDGEHEKDLQ